MKTKKSKITECALCTALLVIVAIVALYPQSSAAANVPPAEICDIASYPEAEMILELANAEILPVYEKNGEYYFLPDEYVTREYVACAIGKLACGDVEKYSPYKLGTFDESEISPDFLPYVKAAAFDGYISVYSSIFDGTEILTFNPKEEMTREQIAGVLSVFADFPVSSSKPAQYADAQSVSDEYKDDIEKLVGLGIMSGKTDALLCPKEPMTKAEFAALLYRLIKAEYAGK